MIVIADCRIDKKALKVLENYGYKNILVPPLISLQKGIASHPDMLMFFFEDKLITSKSYYDTAKQTVDEILSNTGLNLVVSYEQPSCEYPNDVLFNAVVVGKYLIANMKTVSNKIIEITAHKDIIPIDVKQGYTKCSICKVSDNAVITADTGIYNTLSDKTELDVLKIREGSIKLSGYNYGFIGGATGCDLKNIYFCGDLFSHPDGEKIARFCKAHGKDVVCLTETELFDVGTIFLI